MTNFARQHSFPGPFMWTIPYEIILRNVSGSETHWNRIVMGSVNSFFPMVAFRSADRID